MANLLYLRQSQTSTDSAAVYLEAVFDGEPDAEQKRQYPEWRMSNHSRDIETKAPTYERGNWTAGKTPGALAWGLALLATVIACGAGLVAAWSAWIAPIISKIGG
jgi:hypothetical protein